MTEQLKPCPFCGSADLSVISIDYKCYAVECNNCGATGRFKEAKADAKSAWNSRLNESNKYTKEQNITNREKIKMTINTVIIDIETLDTAPTAVILSIGAFAFDRFDLNGTLENIKNSSIEKNEGPYHLYYVCNLNDQLVSSKRTISQSTLDWWRRQSHENNKHIFLNYNSQNLEKALNALLDKMNEWKRLSDNFRFYFRGTDFDPVIIKNAFSEYGLPTPWEYYNVRDVRTYIDALSGDDSGYLDGHKLSFNYIKHNSLHDAMRDAEQMCAAAE